MGRHPTLLATTGAMTCPTRQRTHLVLFIILVGYGYSAHPKEKEEGGDTWVGDAAQAIFGLFQSWISATFGISIVGEIFALTLLKMTIQAFSKYVKLKREGELVTTDNRNIGKTFGGLVIAGSLLVAYYPVFLVNLSNTFADLVFVVANLGIFEVQVILFGMVILIRDMLDIVIASAFLILLRRQQLLHLPETNPRLKTAFDAMISSCTLSSF